ncbi:MAG TPA: ABC transporter permease [Bryobacteraceae bacterium]|nr:ABC transporter permease [Bryobacteraceae bacterium]
MIWKDLRFSARLLARNPVFTLSTVLLLAVAIGANTLIFSMVDALLLRPLPVRDPERLVHLVEVHPTGFVTWELPADLFQQLAARSSTLNDVLCQADLDLALTDSGAVERIRANAISGNFFSALGLHARLGRLLTAEDDRAGAPLAVLSYDFWKRRFAGSPAVLGRAVRLNGRPFTVVGILPAGVNGLTLDTAPDIRIPLNAGRLLWRGSRVDATVPLSVHIFARLRPGVTLERAEAQTGALLQSTWEAALLRDYPSLAHGPRNQVFDSRLRLEPVGNGISSLRAQFSRGLILLMASVGLLLVLACANMACLVLARSAARCQEIAIRLTLGAGPWRIARQLLTDSLLLAIAGGVLGLFLTWLCRPLVVAAIPPIRDRAAVLQPLAIRLAIDTRVLGFCVAATLLTAVLFGMWPAVRGARYDVAESLRGSRTSTARLSSQNILLTVQVAVCVLLLAGAALLVRTFDRIRAMNPGFDRNHVVTFTIDPALNGYTPEQARTLSRQLLLKVRTLPGVTAAAIASRALMRGSGLKGTFGVAGAPVRRSDFLNASLNSVTPEYFKTMGMRIVNGRDFSWSDNDRQKPAKVVVNSAFARRFFPGRDPLGRTFGFAGPDGLAQAQNEIVGVVSDAKYRSLREPIPPTVYHPVVDGFDSDFVLHVRTHGDPSACIEPVRQALRSVAPDLPWIEARTLREEVNMSLWQERLLAWLSSLFSSMAALLVGIGLYGALDLAIRARTREIGVRVALGAAPIRIARLLSGSMLTVLAVGAAAGIAAHFACIPWLRRLFEAVGPLDPGAPAFALLLIAAIGLLAAAPQFWRALHIDAATALRHE